MGLQRRRHDHFFQVSDTTKLHASESELNFMRCCIFVHRAIEDTSPQFSSNQTVQSFSRTPTSQLILFSDSTPIPGLLFKSPSNYLVFKSFNDGENRPAYGLWHEGSLALGQGEDGPANSLRVVRGSRVNHQRKWTLVDLVRHGRQQFPSRRADIFCRHQALSPEADDRLSVVKDRMTH